MKIRTGKVERMLKILLKTRMLALLDRFSGSKDGKKAISAGRVAGLLLCGLVLAGLAGWVLSLVFRPICEGFSHNGVLWLYYALAGGVAFLLSFLMTMFYAQGSIFEAKDNEMLLSMPIPPRAILVSRIGTLYLLNLIITAIVVGTAGIVHAIMFGTSFIGVVIVILCILLLAMIATTLSCLLGWLVSLATRRMRRKALFSVVLSLVFLAAFYFVMWGDIQGTLNSMMANSAGIADIFRGPLYPFYAMGRAIADHDFVMLLIFAAVCIVPFALVFIALTASFVRIVTTKVGAKRLEYKAKAVKQTSVIWALAKKDLIRLGNSSTYMLNAGLGLLFSLILSVGTLFAGNAIIDFLLERFANLSNTNTEIAPYLVAVLLSFFGGYCSIASAAISVENKNLWILKSTPVTANEVLKSKLLSHLVPAVLVSLVSSLLIVIAMPMNGLEILAVFLMPLAAHLFCAHVGLIINLYFGRTDFPDDAKAVKGSVTSLIPSLLTFGLAVLPSILYFTVLGKQGIPISTPILAMTGLLLVLDLAMFLFLGSKAAQKRWECVGQ